jgi:hypothetical protein
VILLLAGYDKNYSDRARLAASIAFWRGGGCLVLRCCSLLDRVSLVGG